MYKNYFKRILDISISIILILILFPLFFVVFTVLYIVNKGKVIFCQQRPGLHMKPFRLYKFKTMNDKKDKNGNLLPDEQRLTLIGKWLRKFSLDELPQLFNVIKGDMSLIGPRPWLMEYVPLYNDYQKRRHEVRPGITGWAQVNGRNTTNWNKRFKYDVYYVENITFGLDLKIFFLTIWNILTAKGISGENSKTMTKFTGNG